MTIKEFYETIGGNYDEAMSRLLKEDRILKYALRFPDQKDYFDMLEAIEKGDVETAFRTSHTLKGVCLNLSFSRLAKSASDLCEMYRNGAPTEDVTPLLDIVKKDYAEVIDSIKKIEQ